MCKKETLLIVTSDFVMKALEVALKSEKKTNIYHLFINGNSSYI